MRGAAEGDEERFDSEGEGQQGSPPQLQYRDLLQALGMSFLGCSLLVLFLIGLSLKKVKH